MNDLVACEVEDTADLAASLAVVIAVLAAMIKVYVWGNRAIGYPISLIEPQGGHSRGNLSLKWGDHFELGLEYGRSRAYHHF